VFLVSGMACKWAASRAHGAAPGATIVYSLSAKADALSDCPKQKDLQMQPFSKAAEGIRTLDLLHGKQDERFPPCTDISCKRAGSRA
jgi:hypothetical protein